MPEILDALDRRARHLVHVDQALFLFLHQVLHRLVDAHLASLRASLKQIAQHVFHVDAHLFDALWTGQLDHREILFPHFELNQTIVELAAAQLRAQLFARTLKLLAIGNVPCCVRFGSVDCIAERALYGDNLGENIRDTNLTPDFPRAAALIDAMQKRAFGTDIDGVISVDPVVLSAVLRATGPVKVGDNLLNAHNIMPFLLKQV